MRLGSDHLLPSCLPFPWAGLSPGFGSVLGPQNLPVLAVLEPSEYPPPPSRLCLNLPWLTRVPAHSQLLGVGQACRGTELPSRGVFVLGGTSSFFIRTTLEEHVAHTSEDPSSIVHGGKDAVFAWPGTDAGRAGQQSGLEELLAPKMGSSPVSLCTCVPCPTESLS